MGRGQRAEPEGGRGGARGYVYNLSLLFMLSMFYIYCVYLLCFVYGGIYTTILTSIIIIIIIIVIIIIVFMFIIIIIIIIINIITITIIH